MPVSIENNRYVRNALLFNVGFVFARDDDVGCYEPVVRKVAKTLRTLELEHHFLSSEHRPRLEGLLADMVESLNRYHECQFALAFPPREPSRARKHASRGCTALSPPDARSLGSPLAHVCTWQRRWWSSTSSSFVGSQSRGSCSSARCPC